MTRFALLSLYASDNIGRIAATQFNNHRTRPFLTMSSKMRRPIMRHDSFLVTKRAIPSIPIALRAPGACSAPLLTCNILHLFTHYTSRNRLARRNASLWPPGLSAPTRYAPPTFASCHPFELRTLPFAIARRARAPGVLLGKRVAAVEARHHGPPPDEQNLLRSNETPERALPRRTPRAMAAARPRTSTHVRALSRTHHSPLTTHHSPLTIHHSSLVTLGVSHSPTPTRVSP
jgi:hypothetical protein